MKHTSNSPHVNILMRGHNSEHREHHFAGGISNAPPHFSKGGKTHKHKRFAKGGHCYSDGGSTEDTNTYGGEKPLTGQLRKGGRARSRQHHYLGEKVLSQLPLVNQFAKGIAARRQRRREAMAGPSAPMPDKGAPAAGAPVADNSVREEHKRGGRTKRSHHYWGQNFIGRLPLVGQLANGIAHSVGTLSPNKYGGSEYVANTPGKKVADVASTLGGVLPALLHKGGSAHRKHRKHHAAGGAGKVRKGMMTESGHMR
jgi:hypothetical protein